MAKHVAPRTLLKDRVAAYPLRIRMVIGIIIAVAGSIAIQYGLDATVVQDQVSQIILGVFDLLVLAGVVKTSEAKVTPLVDPRDNEGHALTPT